MEFWIWLVDGGFVLGDVFDVRVGREVVFGVVGCYGFCGWVRLCWWGVVVGDVGWVC